MRSSFKTFLTFVVTMCASIGQGRAADLLYGIQGSQIVTFDVSLTDANSVVNSKRVFTTSTITNISGLTIDTYNNVYLSNNSNYNGHDVQKFDSNGSLIATIGDASNLQSPTSLAVDFGGSLFVQATGGTKKFDSSGSYLGNFQTTNGYVALASDSMNNIYGVNYFNRVDKYNALGVFQFSVSSNLFWPKGVTVDSNGNMYVANQGDGSNNGFISKYGPSGNFLTSFGSIRGLYSVAIDTIGNIYGNGYDGVFKYNPQGVFQFSWVANYNASTTFATVPRVVPEPSTYALAAIASGVMALIAKRRRKGLTGR